MIAWMSVVSTFLMDLSGPRDGKGPMKGTSIMGPSRCGLEPAGGGPTLPLLLLLLPPYVAVVVGGAGEAGCTVAAVAAGTAAGPRGIVGCT